MKATANISLIIRGILTTISIIVALIFWYQGFSKSPIVDPKQVNENRFLTSYLQRNKPDLKEERVLSESYWLRYRDVREHPYWGENGPMGIWGPRDHYKLLGKREGRIFKPVIRPDDLEKERDLAEAYWSRYPAIRRSGIWGENSRLGILGPRDHYNYIGKNKGRLWGIQEPH